MSTSFYNQLAVKILRICERNKDVNGGVMAIREIIEINNSRKKNDQISTEDVLNALKQMSVFGPVVSIINNSYVSMGSFLPSAELSVLLEIYQLEKKVNWGICEARGWSPERFSKAIVE